jgi:hypothetical protein
MPDTQVLELFIKPERAGTYFTLPFSMPPHTEAFTLSYQYERHLETPVGAFTSRREVNIIDLGLIAPNGVQVGASGSDRQEFHLSETRATPGYRPCPLVQGEWQILVGAYKIAPAGVTVRYQLTFTPKRRRLLKGDLHAHTLASDGVLTVDELARLALRHGLDFLAVTDHNQMVSQDALPKLEGLTLIPGVEWTHYQGHANFLGVEKPYDGSFFTNILEEARERFETARARGALITLNHPFEPGMGMEFGFDSLPFDCLEIWNGPMRESNLRAVGQWQALLAAGRKLPAVGGSDFHRATPFQFLGGPTTCVYALSAGPSDILAALRQGKAYITFAPDGPGLELSAGGEILGGSVPWPAVKNLRIRVEGLLAGDVVRVVTPRGSEPILQAPEAGSFSADYPIPAPGFGRLEVLRAFLPGLPLLPALISNPIYFEENPSIIPA